MASNSRINFFTSSNEQLLIEDLVVEAIKFYAHDAIYLPRTQVNPDLIFNELEYYTFTTHCDVEVYIKSYESFQGDGSFFSKFGGLEVRDKLLLTMSIRSFKEFIAPTTNMSRPLEGDLIYIPMTKAAYSISKVETAEVFYQVGALQTYELVCDLFEISNEVFDTGLEIDDILNKYRTETDITNDAFEQNDDIQVEANTVLNWSETNPFGDF